MATIFKTAKEKSASKEQEKDANSNVTMTKRMNNQRVLILSSRGINFRYVRHCLFEFSSVKDESVDFAKMSLCRTSRQRHLMTDLEALLPHSKKGM